MSTDFSRLLALLRRERGISQRKAATDLNVSQALLSHYENGVRVPGLSFIVRACDYYSVSADFLLGRTMARDGTTIAPEELYDSSVEKENNLRGSVMAMLQKKLLANSISLLFDLMAKTGNRNIVLAASAYLSAAVYKLFFSLTRECGGAELFPRSVPPCAFSCGGPESELHRAELSFVGALLENRESGGELPDIKNGVLEREYPNTYPSLLQVLRGADERIAQQLPHTMLK